MENIEKMVLTRLAEDFYRPIAAQELAAAMKLSRDKVNLALSSLAAKKVLLQEGEDYSLNPEADIVAGFFQSHVRGYGFIHVGRDRQYYVGPGAAKGARDGDILLCQVLGREPGKAPAVKVLDFLARTEKIVAAVYNGQSHLGSVQDGNRKIMIPARHSKGAKDGDCVLAAIPGWEGRVISLLDQEDRPYLDLLNIAARKGILPVFPEAVEAEAAALQEAAGEKRLDLREQEMVTVDGEESQDLDDGFSLSRESDGTWRLGIHIADVAHYVRPGSQLDREAFRRALSVYLVDREVPMLPERLSRDLCSLLPGRDRLALSCLAEISPAGEVISYQFAETVVRSRARLTYSQAEAGCSNGLLALAAELGQLLNARRMERGAAYIELPTTAITLDANGRPISMGPRETGGPRGLVEEFMVLANELAADFLYKNGASLLYRGNEGFYPGREEDLNAYLARWGCQLAYPPSSRELQQLLAAISGRREELLISRKLARSLHKSRYSWTPLGHYNLAAERYIHFSSPIRRYSDLFVHRQIKQVLNRQPLLALERDLPRVAEQCSFRERLAQDIEGACLEQKKLEYMAAQADTLFKGLVAELTNSGPLVWLENTAEGIVVAGDRQLLDNCQPGDPMTVQVHKLDYKTKSIYFSCAGGPGKVDRKIE
jgi:ribonuclease R